MAYINGYAYLVGLTAVVITLAWTSATFIFQIANTLNITQISSQGANVGLYIGLIIGATLYNLLGLKYSAYLNKFMGKKKKSLLLPRKKLTPLFLTCIVGWVLIGTLVIIVAIPAMAPTHNSAAWVFTEFTNNTGYTNKGLVFFVGMVSCFEKKKTKISCSITYSYPIVTKWLGIGWLRNRCTNCRGKQKKNKNR